MDQRYKRRIYDILEISDPENSVTKVINFFLLALIVLNVITVILESVESIDRTYRDVFQLFSEISIIIFTVEYLLRIWSCDVDKEYSRPLLGRLRYAMTPLMLIDLMVLLPFYMVYIFPRSRFLRSLRILWTFRLLKVSRYSTSLQTIIDVVKAQKEQLAMSFTAILFFMVLSSTLVYFLEHNAQPQNFPNIPATMWWAVLTMTTIGESVYPVTPLGKVIGALIIILGVATFALPTSILTSGFVDELGRRREEAQKKEESEEGRDF